MLLIRHFCWREISVVCLRRRCLREQQGTRTRKHRGDCLPWKLSFHEEPFLVDRPAMRCRKSEHEPKTELYEASAIHSARDLSEGRASARGIGIGKVRAVKQVVELASKLNVTFLRKVKIFQERSIEVDK